MIIVFLIFFRFYADGKKPKDVCQWFYFKLEKTDIFRHFKDLYKINADRVMKRQINMVHIKSGIRCLLVFERDHNIVRSTEIINRFAAEPMCKTFYIQIQTMQLQSKMIDSTN